MALRVEKQQANAQKLAEFLSSHPRVNQVNYAGFSGHSWCSLHSSQAKGADVDRKRSEGFFMGSIFSLPGFAEQAHCPFAALSSSNSNDDLSPSPLDPEVI